MRELNAKETNEISGAGPWATVAADAGLLAAGAGAAGAIPSPATPALLATGLVLAVISWTAARIDAASTPAPKLSDASDGTSGFDDYAADWGGGGDWDGGGMTMYDQEMMYV